MKIFSSLVFKFYIGILFIIGISGNSWAATKSIINIEINKNGNFSGILKNASLNNVLNKISDYTKLKFIIYPNIQEEYTFTFKDWSESKLLNIITKDINSFRVLSKNDPTKTKLLILASQSDKKFKEYQSKINIKDIEFDFDKRLINFNKAKKINTDILKLPEVLSLVNLSKKQKKYDLLYSRIVNPNNPSSAYAFKVRYSKQHDMMIPFEKNGEAITGKAEGFMNFSTVAKSINKKSNNLVAYRDGKDLYLRFKDINFKDTFILLSGDSSNMEIIQKIATPGFPNMQTRLNGNTNQFTSLSMINHKNGQVILSDSVVTQ